MRIFHFNDSQMIFQKTESEAESASLKKSILMTLALFAAQEQAPTLLEIRRVLLRSSPSQNIPSLWELKKTLERDLSDSIARESGLYCLRGSERTFAARRGRSLNSARLLRKARRRAGGIRHLPYVRGAAVSGSSAQLNAVSDSDIDLFVIAKPGRIFTARFLVSAYFQILGLRRHGNKVSGRFCLNHYVAEDAELSDDHTPYTALLYASFLSVFGRGRFRGFFERNSDWIRKFIVNPELPISSYFKNSDREQSYFAKFLEILFFPFSGAIEALLRVMQKRRIREEQYVVVSESELAFHPGSKGQQLISRYQEILERLKIKRAF